MSGAVTNDATEKGGGRYPLFRSILWSESGDRLKKADLLSRATEGVKVASGLVGRVVLTDDKTGFDLVIFHKGLILSFGSAN